MRSILIVEDDPLVRKTLASQLAKKGFEVTVAETGEDGVRMYAESATDIVLLDVRLPDIDGLEVLRRIRERSRRAVILVMTAFDDMKTTVEAIKLGAFEYLVKPLDTAELDLAIDKAFQVRAPRGEGQLPRRGEAEGIHHRQHHRPLGRDAQRLQAHRLRGQHPGQHPHPGRERHRQGARGQGHPLQQPVPGRALHRHQLLGHPGHPARIGALRPRQGRLHRRGQRDEGQVRDRRQGHAVPGRGRRRLAQPPEQAPAGHRVAGFHEGRRGEGAQDRGADHRRDQPEPQGPDRQGPVPGGPLLPPQGRRDPSCRPCGNAARTSPTWWPTCWRRSTGNCAATSARCPPR